MSETLESIEALIRENEQLLQLLNSFNWTECPEILKERDALRARMDSDIRCRYPTCKCNQPDDCARQK